jgi:hypothetical protein
MVTCKNCGEKNLKDAKFCESCGKELKETTSKQKSEKNKQIAPCKDCGKLISKNAEVCPNCGVRLKRSSLNSDITRGITKPLKPLLGASGAILIGPFAYLYVRRYVLCVVWLILGGILSVITNGIAIPFLWIGWACHIYIIAKQINEELIK